MEKNPNTIIANARKISGGVSIIFDTLIIASTIKRATKATIAIIDSVFRTLLGAMKT